MNGMSIFNSGMPESQSNPVLNLDWSGFARSSDVERASGKVAGSIEKTSEKMTGKLSGTIEKEVGRLGNDVQKSTGQITAAIKDNTDKISDAVKRSAVNNAEQTSPTADVKALCQGLIGVSKTTAQIADAALINPAEIPAALQSAKAISKQFADLIDRASKYAEEGKRFRETAAEVEKAAGWVGSNFPSGQCIPITNGAVDVFGAFGRLSDFN